MLEEQGEENEEVQTNAGREEGQANISDYEKMQMEEWRTCAQEPKTGQRETNGGNAHGFHDIEGCSVMESDLKNPMGDSQADYPIRVATVFSGSACMLSVIQYSSCFYINWQLSVLA